MKTVREIPAERLMDIADALGDVYEDDGAPCTKDFEDALEKIRELVEERDYYRDLAKAAK
jgi:hypothetical protein